MSMQFAAAILSAFEVVLMSTEDGQTLTASNTHFHEETIRYVSYPGLLLRTNECLRRVANFRCRYVARHT